MTPELFVSLTANGLALGMLFFLLASGLSLIFGLMDVLNFAHGAFFVWGSYIWLAAFKASGNFYAGLLAALIGGFVLGIASEMAFIRPLYKRPIFQVLLTLGLALVLNELVITFWGPNALTVPPVPGLTGTERILGAAVARYRLFVIGSGMVILALTFAFLRFSRWGIIIRAAVENGAMVQALGINVPRLFTLMFGVGAALAALGGAVATPYFNSAYPQLGQDNLLYAFIIVVLGGMGSIAGTAAASLFLGLAQSYVAFFALSGQNVLPQGVPSAAPALVAVALLVIVLLARPQGLLGTGSTGV